MKRVPRKQILVCLCVLLGGTLLSVFGAVSVLRNLGGIVGMLVEADADAAFDFARIFEQTKDASIAPHWLLPLLTFGAYALALLRFFRGAKRSAARFLLCAVPFVLLLAFGFACSLMLTRVNGIRFCDLLGALLPVIGRL